MYVCVRVCVCVSLFALTLVTIHSMNYYMFGGGYNRDRYAAAGITNMYASDVMLCSSGERHQPKFDHLQRLHQVLRDYASLFLLASTRAWPEAIEIRDEKGDWANASDGKSLLFRYKNETTSIVLIENMRSETITARWNISLPGGGSETAMTELFPWSVTVFEGFRLRFGSSTVYPSAKAYRRFSRQVPLPPAHATVRVLVPSDCANGWTSTSPIEHTTLMLKDKTLTDYTWYSTEWDQKADRPDSILAIETELSNGIIVFVDGRRVGANVTVFHGEGPVTLTIDMPALSAGRHHLDILSESLGYSNMIGGSWGASTTAKVKGITGDVYFRTEAGNQSLVQGQEWCSCLGLFSCGSVVQSGDDANNHVDEDMVRQSIWRFPKILLDKGERLFVHIPIGRGHIHLNNVDLGRFWDIKRSESGRYSQSYYLIIIITYKFTRIS